MLLLKMVDSILLLKMVYTMLLLKMTAIAMCVCVCVCVCYPIHGNIHSTVIKLGEVIDISFFQFGI
jgi:hypothetical protein